MKLNIKHKDGRREGMAETLNTVLAGEFGLGTRRRNCQSNIDRFWVISKQSVCVVASVMLAASIGAASVVIDHASVDLYSQIPDASVAAVKKMWLSIPGESHSYGYRKGCALLAAQEPRFAAIPQESGIPAGPTSAYLRVSRASWGNVGHSTGWSYSYGEADWYTSPTAIARTKAFLQYANDQHLGLAAVGFGWCWDATWHNSVGGGIDPVHQVRWAGSSEGGPMGDMRWGLDAEDAALTGNSVCMDTYLAATQSYVDYCKANGLATKVVFTTGAIDGSAGEAGYQRHLKYERIRDYVRNSTDNVLFDYADILSWNNAGQRYTRTWTDYGGRVQTYSMVHPDNMIDLNGSYTEDGDHIGEIGAIRLAKALWVMLAQNLHDPPQDTTPPAIVGASLEVGGMHVAFSEPVDVVSGGLVANYIFAPALPLAEATVEGAVVHLSVSSMPDGAYDLVVEGVADVAGNVMLPVVVPLVVDQTAPTLPGPLVGTTVDATTVRLDWSVSTDASGAVSYEVYRAGALVGKTGSTSYVDGGQVPGATHEYGVRAVDAHGNWSAAVTTVTFPAAPAYVLTVGGVNGSVQRTPDQPAYLAGAPVVLTAVGIEGYVFDHWEGDLSGKSNPVSVLIQADATVTAVFVEQPPISNVGLAGYWAMDEGSGTVVADVSGQENHGVLQNGAAWGAGLSGWGVSLDGVNDYVGLGTGNFGIANEFTVSLWMKGTVLGGRRMVLAQRGEYAYPFMMRVDTNRRLEVGLRAGSSVTYLLSNTVLQPNRWYHVTATYAGGQRIIYIDGLEDRRDTTSGLLVVKPGEVTSLGVSPAAHHPFSGVLDAVRIYSRALSPGEVLWQCEADLGLHSSF